MSCWYRCMCGPGDDGLSLNELGGYGGTVDGGITAATVANGYHNTSTSTKTNTTPMTRAASMTSTAAHRIEAP